MLGIRHVPNAVDSSGPLICLGSRAHRFHAIPTQPSFGKVCACRCCTPKAFYIDSIQYLRCAFKKGPCPEFPLGGVALSVCQLSACHPYLIMQLWCPHMLIALGTRSELFLYQVSGMRYASYIVQDIKQHAMTKCVGIAQPPENSSKEGMGNASAIGISWATVEIVKPQDHATLKFNHES